MKSILVSNQTMSSKNVLLQMELTGVLTLGYHSVNDVILSGQKISARHASIFFREDPNNHSSLGDQFSLDKVDAGRLREGAAVSVALGYIYYIPQCVVHDFHRPCVNNM